MRDITGLLGRLEDPVDELSVANRLLPKLERAEEHLGPFAKVERGTLRIGMECHPCYQWLLKIVSPYLADWPAVDVDLKQKFQFGGIGALYETARGLLRSDIT